MTHGSEKRQRTAHLTIRLTPDERMAIDQAADSAGLTAGSYARHQLFTVPPPRQVRRPPVEKRELTRVLGALGYIGNNLNQIAHAANAGDGVDVAGLEAALAELRPLRDALMRALGREP
jgi:hypothetical protein